MKEIGIEAGVMRTEVRGKCHVKSPSEFTLSTLFKQAGQMSDFATIVTLQHATWHLDCF